MGVVNRAGLLGHYRADPVRMDCFDYRSRIQPIGHILGLLYFNTLLRFDATFNISRVFTLTYIKMRSNVQCDSRLV